MAAIAAALLPVLVFLALLVFLDSFKLVSSRTIARAVAAGAAAAVVSLPINAGLIAAGVPLAAVSRYAAPLLEETVKLIAVAAFIWRRRVGFLVDAAIVGFAVGTGFALVENLHYLRSVAHHDLILWLVRGFGTAVLHGATTAIAAILVQRLVERRTDLTSGMLLPGWTTAVFIHFAFNQVVLPPVAATLLLLIVLPLLVLVVFDRSERATRDWVRSGMDLDLESLTTLLSKQFDHSRAGVYLHQLRTRFPGPVVADMFCLLQLELELAIRAKGLLMAREAGLEVPADKTIAARLKERRYLQASVGRTGLLALRPLQAAGGREQWARVLLEDATRS